MVFSSMTFLVLFLPALLFFYFIISDWRWRNAVLLCASLLFYGWGEPVWIGAMIFSTAVNYFCALTISRTDSALYTLLRAQYASGMSQESMPLVSAPAWYPAPRKPPRC